MTNDYVDKDGNVAHLVKVENEIATFIVNDEKERQELAWSDFIKRFNRIGSFLDDDDDSFMVVVKR